MAFSLRKAWSLIPPATGRVWIWLRRKIPYLIFFALSILIVLYIGRNTNIIDQDPNNDNIADDWNHSIAKLGVLPVYPPQEDLYVGDIYAVIVDPCGVAAVAEEPKPETPCQKPFGDSAVRIDHIDIGDGGVVGPPLPRFSDTVTRGEKDDYRREDTDEIMLPPPDSAGSEKRKIGLTFAAFPGVTISHTDRRSGHVGGLGAFFQLGRKAVEHQDIEIPIAETYGAKLLPTFKELDNYCRNSKTKTFCSDMVLRKLMSFVLGQRIYETKNGQYTNELQLQLVSRVYLTRQILVRNSFNDVRAFTAEGGLDAKPELSKPSTEAKLVSPNTHDTKSQSESLKVDSSLQNGRSFGTDGVYQRPLAFGYRALTVKIVPSCPIATPPATTCHCDCQGEHR